MKKLRICEKYQPNQKQSNAELNLPVNYFQADNFFGLFASTLLLQF